jgi:phage terminase large subunit
MIENHEIYYPLYTDKDHFIILVTGGRGCEAPDTEVIMSDLTTKQIRDIKVGDMVMGDDFTPRKVLMTYQGRSEMFRVSQTSAEDYFVNDKHILTLKKSNSSKRDKGKLTKHGTYRRPNGRYPQYDDIVDMNVVEYADKSKHFRDNFRGFKAGSIPYPEQEVDIEPYLLGLWLGDGTAKSPIITNADTEVLEWLQDYCDRHKQYLHYKYSHGAYRISIIGSGKVGGNDFRNNLKRYNLIGNKHIPRQYISNSERVRLELLAGIIDTDGYMKNNGYELTQKRKCVAKQVKYIADTLGFRTSIHEKRAYYKGKDCGVVYRLHINGDVWRIPCRVKRRQIRKEDCRKNKDWRLSQLSVTPAGVGDWCGMMLDGNHRYLHADGTVTHNSGKSFGVATFIERLTFELKKRGIDDRIVHNILYSRYTMVSAAMSVIPEFMEKVQEDGTQKYFHATRTDVINRMTGSKIMFRGLRTSSGNQTARLKSIHGLTTFVCDEAEEWTSEREFETIAFSIRQPGIQNRIIVMMNPTDSNHFIYQKYIKDTHRIEYFDGVPVQISTHPQVLHLHTTYLDNVQHLSEEFIKSAQEMKEKDPEKYAHIFMGQWSDVAEGAVFKNWGVVNEFPKQCKKVALGLDFGYTHDPSACVRCGIFNNDLYIDEVFYRTGMGVKDLSDALKKENLFVYSDSADPRLIDEIANNGVIIYPVAKPAGSIIAGIEKMKDFDNIFITERSYNVQQEFRNYVWAKDKDDNYINMPEDHDNHCVDAIRYFINGHILGQIVKPRRISSDQLGIF